MSEGPHSRRRWLQFRLSTWFVLVAILCWAISLAPRLKFEHANGRAGVSPSDIFIAEFYRQSANGPTSRWAIKVWDTRGLLWPASALAAFVCWKLVWRVVEGRGAKRVKEETLGQSELVERL